MNTSETIASIPPELASQFQEAGENLAKVIRRPDKMQAACEHVDRLREEKR